VGEAEEPALEVVVEDTFGFGDEGCEYGIFADLELLEWPEAIDGADAESGRTFFEEGEASLAVKVNGGLHKEAAEVAEVGGSGGEREPGIGLVDFDEHAELAVEVILGADFGVGDLEVEVGLMFGHAPDAFAAFDGDFGGDGEVEDVLADVVVFGEEQSQETGGGLEAVGAGDGDAVLDVFADVGDLVVDDCDDEEAFVPETEGVEFVSGHEGFGFIGVDGEDGHEDWGFVARYGHLEGDAIDEGVSAGLL